MAPSYEICAEESLVLSAEKYADALIHDFDAAAMRGSLASFPPIYFTTATHRV